MPLHPTPKSRCPVAPPERLSLRDRLTVDPGGFEGFGFVQTVCHQTHLPSRHLLGCQNGSRIGVSLAAACPQPRT